MDLHIIFSDIMQGAGHIDDVFPYFLRHAKTVFPHLDCMDDLKKISDLRQPANWYSNARAITRKIVFHAGPTNSGKTYHAMERYLGAKSGVYCGPLKLLATEVFNKANERGTPCDLVTGEERKFGISETSPANHVACTVEMTSVNTPCKSYPLNVCSNLYSVCFLNKQMRLPSSMKYNRFEILNVVGHGLEHFLDLLLMKYTFVARLAH